MKMPIERADPKREKIIMGLRMKIMMGLEHPIPIICEAHAMSNDTEGALRE
jgi:hypothetical protein